MKRIKSFGRGWPADRLRTSLCDVNLDVAHALANHFADASGVEVLHGNLLDLDTDCLVSPANSFGDMGGGIDRAIDNFYGGAAQRAVMARFAEHFCGELPVGMAVVIEMSRGRFPFLVSSPTMRVPGDISATINVYLSMRAALVAIERYNTGSARRIASVAVPGLGTGVGAVPFDAAARQMRAAYDMIILDGWKQLEHPAQAPFALGDKATFHWRNR